MDPLIEITRAETSDAELLLEMQKEAFLSEARLYGDPDIAPMKETREMLLEAFGTHIILKALYDGEMAGSIRLSEKGGQWWVGRLFVAPKYQRRGIGRALLTEVEEYAQQAKRFVLFTGPQSTGNIRLYESCGYRTTGEFIPDANTGMGLVMMAKDK